MVWLDEQYATTNIRLLNAKLKWQTRSSNDFGCVGTAMIRRLNDSRQTMAMPSWLGRSSALWPGLWATAMIKSVRAARHRGKSALHVCQVLVITKMSISLSVIILVVTDDLLLMERTFNKAKRKWSFRCTIASRRIGAGCFQSEGSESNLRCSGY